MQPNGGPITECPVCRYSLEGLPRDYQCPECGFGFDHRMRVWSGGLSVVHSMGLILGVCMSLSGLLNLNAFAASTFFDWLRIAFSLGFMAFGVSLARTSIRRLQFRNFIIVGKSNILTRADSAKIETLPLRELRISRGSSRVLIFRGDEPHPIALPMIARPNRSQRIREEIDEYIVECWKVATGKTPQEIPWNRDWYAENVIVADKGGRMRRVWQAEVPKKAADHLDG
jgi:hypothetical protein